MGRGSAEVEVEGATKIRAKKWNSGNGNWEERRKDETG
jgi:hypothetical protein